MTDVQGVSLVHEEDTRIPEEGRTGPLDSPDRGIHRVQPRPASCPSHFTPVTLRTPTEGAAEAKAPLARPHTRC